MRTILICTALLLAVGCNRKPKVPEPTEAGPGSYCQLGPVGLSVESVRHGKVRMRGMMGQDGESKDTLFTVKTRFKLIDTGTPVKQAALQSDGSMIVIGDGGLKLTDANGVRFKQVSAAGFDSMRARRTDTAILTPEKPEATDLLTFESVSGATGDLTLEVPANYQEQQPDGTFRQPKEPGAFRFRIPRAMWDAPPPTTDAGPGHWATIGPVSVSVESVRVGKVKIEAFPNRGIGESKDDVFIVNVRVKLADPNAKVKKPPFVPARIAAFSGPAVTLRRARGGEEHPVLTAFGLDQIVGRQTDDIELSAKKPELTDLLTFDAKAAGADELILTLWPRWEEQQPDGKWADVTPDGDFRFRIPKAMWAK